VSCGEVRGGEDEVRCGEVRSGQVNSIIAVICGFDSRIFDVGTNPSGPHVNNGLEPVAVCHRQTTPPEG